MKVVHKFENRAIKKEGEGSFLLTDKHGTFLSLGSNSNISHMQGLFQLDNNWNNYKSIENIRLDKEITELENNFTSIIRRYGDSEEIFSLTSIALIYEVKNFSGDILLELDFRSMYDFSDENRTYSISREDNLIIVFYQKDNKWMVISGAGDFETPDEWVRKEYPYDKLRNTNFEFYTYSALRIKCENKIKLFISVADSKEKAIEDVRNACNNEQMLRDVLELGRKKVCTSGDFAYNCALNSLSGLRTEVDINNQKSEGVYAGLPWFNQFWSRDELISLKAFMIEKEYDFVKRRLMNYVNSINGTGRLPNRLPHSILSSADSIGWLFKRIYDFIIILKDEEILDKYLSVQELRIIKHKLHISIEEQMAQFMKDYLIYNEANETWMDTSISESDGRKGPCIEIQALFLASFKLMRLLCRELKFSYTDYNKLEDLFSKEIRKNFLKEKILVDSLNNPIARPNIFIAYYAYPELLKKHEWKTAFNKILNKLWLDWGGLATIDKNNGLFQSRYTGHNNLSYHRGDSWFWINNLAAICLIDLDKKRYDYQIDYIHKASEKELMFSGFIGHCAELSSAEDLRSEGCMSQAWSAALFIELCEKLKP